MLFGNTSIIAAQNAKNNITPLAKANKDITKYTKKLASTAGAQAAANDNYNNLINTYYNDLAYARNAKINALDTPDSGDIWSSPEAAQSYYWQTTGAKKISGLKKQVKNAISSNAELAKELSKYQNLLQESEQDKSYAVQQKLANEEMVAGILESLFGFLTGTVGVLLQ